MKPTSQTRSRFCLSLRENRMELLCSQVDNHSQGIHDLAAPRGHWERVIARRRGRAVEAAMHLSVT